MTGLFVFFANNQQQAFAAIHHFWQACICGKYCCKSFWQANEVLRAGRCQNTLDLSIRPNFAVLCKPCTPTDNVPVHIIIFLFTVAVGIFVWSFFWASPYLGDLTMPNFNKPRCTYTKNIIHYCLRCCWLWVRLLCTHICPNDLYGSHPIVSRGVV